MPHTISYIIPDALDGQTVQTFLRRECSMSWRMVVKLKRVENGILLDGVHARTIDTIRAGQTLQVTMPEDAVRIEGADIPLDIVYEDDDLLVINKPPFLAVHPSAGKPDPTLANAVVSYFKKAGTPLSFRPLNRLDRNTSGLLLAAKNPHVAFVMRTAAKKRYYAVVCGELHGSGTIDQPIRVKEGCAITREVGEGGKDSVTHWEALSTNGRFTVVSVVIDTGRTHQIRVHMSWLGYPLAGDTMYGTDESVSRHALHCADMTFVHPMTEETLSLHAPLPDDLRGWLEKEDIVCPP
ncbi:MAG: RluA family pseudouridine synthase [Ruminococcaceae bacterium]|nr:RluA family pseudouridine synthase [Oscillospiraceae bacterium]